MFNPPIPMTESSPIREFHVGAQLSVDVNVIGVSFPTPSFWPKRPLIRYPAGYGSRGAECSRTLHINSAGTAETLVSLQEEILKTRPTQFLPSYWGTN